MKLKRFILFLIMGFIFIPRMFAIEITDPVVSINYEKNLYVEEFDETAVFDKNTNTLYLTNFEGEAIYFDGFSENDTINIVLKGNNIIDSGNFFNDIDIGTSALEVYCDIKELNITSVDNGLLYIMNFFDGIKVNSGNININKANIYVRNCITGGIYTYEFGNINIKDSNVTIDSSDFINFQDDAFSSFFFCSFYSKLGKIDINNSYIKANGTNMLLIGYNGVNVTNNSKIEVEHINISLIYFQNSNVNILNSKIDIKDSDGSIIMHSIDNSGDNVLISNSNISANNISNDNGKENIAVFDVQNMKSFKVTNNSVININNALSGFNLLVENILFENSVINVSDVYDAFTVLQGMIDSSTYYENGVLTFKNCDVKVDNSNSTKHLIHAINNILPVFNIIESNVVINNNSNNEFVPNDIWDDNHNYSDFPLYEVAIINGNITDPSDLIIENSSIKIDAIYTKTGFDKTIKSGILNMMGKTIINNSEIHINVDESGSALLNVIMDGTVDDPLTLKGGIDIVNDDFEIRKYSFYILGVYAAGGEIDTTVPSEILDLSGLAILDPLTIFIMNTMPNKVDIEGMLELTYHENDGSNRTSKIKTTGFMKELPNDIFENTNKRTFKGWSLSKNGEIITSLNVDKNTTLYAIWDDPRTYSYKFILDNAEFDKNKVSIKTLKIDGSYMYFDKLEIEGINLEKGTDYTVSEGSTIITFTESGINKLNTLGVGTHKLTANYTNGKKAEGSISIKEKITPKEEDKPEEQLPENPKTSDNILFYMLSTIIFIIGLISVSLRTNKNRI